MWDWLPTMFASIAGGGLFGGIAALMLLRVNRDKVKAEARLLGVNAEDMVSGRALDMYDRIAKQAEAAQSKAEACSDKVDALEDHIDHLERIMRDNGLRPPAFLWPREMAAHD